MSISDLFWLFFIFTALQPVLQQRLQEAMRTRKIAQLERQRNSRVILLNSSPGDHASARLPARPLH